ncbi:MAG: tRNA (N6-isopentenyl adenosine(37)-C2)-methylthiotransferase MiaB [Candidatus Marinimicrobia bacterium]|nr:tRNA (N6-isopentenyl adenosine(37)-C2)-methylthiotransferase MiaB [Candidatus Neomarinimicrobiota bacterium]
MEQKKYYIETYGCQMNVYDSELVGSMLNKCGYQITDDIKSADAIFLNTCAIREKAEETVHNKLDSLQSLKNNKPELLLGVLGCMAQNLKDVILDSKPYVDVVLGPDSYRRIPEIITNRNENMNHYVDTRLSKFEVYDDMFPSRREGVNAWISIMRGCDKFCTFCIVPFTRGRERSRSIEGIKKEAVEAVRQGFVEITLLGQNVNSYRTPEGDFSNLLDEIAQIEGIKRIRYTSPHPQDIDENLVKVMAKHSNICNNIHLPLQAGSDRILKRMNRTYTKQEFLNLVKMIRSIIPDCELSTDIIVGFPGETEDEFKETIEVVKASLFNSAFMFKYSSRPGTKASQYSDQISEDEKQARLEELINVQKETTLLRNQRYIGQTVDVLIEKDSKRSELQWSGRTEGNMWVVFDKSNCSSIKDIVKVKINSTHGVTLFGEIVNSLERKKNEAA